MPFLFKKRFLVASVSLLLGCAGDEMSADAFGPPAEDRDDTAGDDGGEGDGEWGTDSDLPAEKEVDADYLVPKGSGRFVFISDTGADSVVVVDSETLKIEVVEVGSRPTHVVPLGEENRAAVICLGSDIVTVMSAEQGRPVTTTTYPVRPDTNALAASADGTRLIAWFDSRFAAMSGAPATDQEITIIDLNSKATRPVRHTTVGLHPFSVRFSEDGLSAFVLSESGINVIDFGDPQQERPRLVAPLEAGSFDPELTDVVITPDGSLAFVRAQGLSALVTASLKPGISDVRSYSLPEAPTDLDMAPNGQFATIVLRGSKRLGICPLPLPEDAKVEPCSYVDLGARIAGLASLSPDSSSALLHTTVSNDETDRRRLTLVQNLEAVPVVTSVLLERPIQSVVLGADGQTGAVIHAQISPKDPATLPHAYTLVSLPDLSTKLQQVHVAPGQLLLTPDGEHGFLLLPQSRRVDLLDLSSFIVDTLPLGSVPTAAGYASGTDKVFVNQDHPDGRMTFIGVRDGSVKTVTGYALNDEIEY
jgi:hypothetical protein